MMRSKWLLMAFLLIVLVSACNQRPDSVIDEETMTALLTDVHLSEGLIDLQNKNVKEDPEFGQHVMAAVLLKYNVSKADYDTSMVWYSQHLNSLIRIYKHVNQNLKEQEEQWTLLAEAASGTGRSASGDSVSLWNQANYCVMDEARLSHFMIWTWQSDTAYHAGDSIRWSMHLPDLPEGECLVASLLLLRTNNQSSEVIEGCTTAALNRDTVLHLSCAADSAVKIDQVVATLHLLPTDSTMLPLRPCLVDSLQMIRKHRKN